MTHSLNQFDFLSCEGISITQLVTHLSSFSILGNILVQFFSSKEQNPFKLAKNKTLCVYMCECVCRYISEYAKWDISDGFNDKTDNFLYTDLQLNQTLCLLVLRSL